MKRKPQDGLLCEIPMSMKCLECGHVGELLLLLGVADAKEWRKAKEKEKKKALKKRKSE